MTATGKPVPSIDRIWVVTKANLMALIVATLSLLGTGYVVIHADQEGRVQRRKEFCAGIHYAFEHPLIDGLAKAFHTDPNSPEADSFRQDLSDGLGPKCTGPVGQPLVAPPVGKVGG